MEVIYTGIRQTPERIVATAVQEDVDVVGLSCLSGAHNVLFPKIAQGIQEKGKPGVLLFGGGIIPLEDIPGLKQAGFAEIFLPGTDTNAVVKFIQEHVSR
jgi:methylmalonyl-CoA mutase C-terminal domain/subunit